MKDLTKELHFVSEDKTTLIDIEKLANKLLSLTWTIDIYRHKLKKEINLQDLGWSFEFNSRKRAAGLCSKKTKTIYISKWLLNQNLHKALEFENTLRHELAHALDFEMRGTSDHSRIWKAVAREVLCNAERCYSSNDIAVTETTKYTLSCPDCDYTRASHKKRKENSRSHPCCTTCYNEGKGYIKLVQTKNY